MKKITAKKAAQKPLVQANFENRFWLCNGQVLSNLKELAEALDKISADDFKSHVNSEKNDFARWIEDILMDAKLAKSISKIKTAKAMAKKIKSAI